MVLHLGSNLENPLKQILLAHWLIEEEIGKIQDYSLYYKTKAWGNEDQNDFINSAVRINTKLDPQEVLKKIQKIELEMGRMRLTKWGPRIIDLDIIFFNSLILNSSNLNIPHKLIQDRKFVLIPLMDIVPEFVHPILNKTTKELLASCKDTLEVIKL